MALGIQESGPLFGDPFTDDQWDAIYGADMGIVGDKDGSAFTLTLPPTGITAELGSATVESRLVSAGRGLRVPVGTTQSLDIPASSGGGTNGRTDLIVARTDLDTFTVAPGPCRLVRIPGTEGSLTVPSYDPATDLRLYAVRRKQGEALNQTIVTDLRQWSARSILVKAGTTLPVDAPLGTRATRDGVVYRRDMVGSSPDWVEESRPREVIEGITVVSQPGEGFLRKDGSRLVRDGADGKDRFLKYVVWKGSPSRNPNPAMDGALHVGTLHDEDKPIGPDQTPLTGWAIDEGGTTRAAMGYIAPNGQIWWTWASANVQFGADGRDKTLVLTGSWKRA